MKLPALQFYPADWRKDPGVQSLSRHDKSVWFDMLCIMHESDERGVLLLAGKPMPEEALARILNLDNQEVKQILSTLLTYGVASQRQEDGAIYCRRMVRDENLIQIRRSAGKMGGNPLLLKQNPKQKPTTPVKQKPTPSSSSSFSSSEVTILTNSNSKAKCTLDEAKAFAVEIGMPESDGEASWHKWEGNGWKNGGNAVKDWKATLRSWKASGYLPSQKKTDAATPAHRQRGYQENLQLP
jgi:hypothetical protein